MIDLINILHEGQHSLVVEKEEIYTFDGRGVSNLFQLLEENPALLYGSMVADKAIGKAAATLMALAKVKQVYADVVSQPAVELLESHKIPITYGNIVPYIINRTDTGSCPLEARCLSCVTLQECYAQIRNFMKEIKTN